MKTLKASTLLMTTIILFGYLPTQAAELKSYSGVYELVGQDCQTMRNGQCKSFDTLCSNYVYITTSQNTVAVAGFKWLLSDQEATGLDADFDLWRRAEINGPVVTTDLGPKVAVSFDGKTLTKKQKSWTALPIGIPLPMTKVDEMTKLENGGIQLDQTVYVSGVTSDWSKCAYKKVR